MSARPLDYDPLTGQEWTEEDELIQGCWEEFEALLAAEAAESTPGEPVEPSGAGFFERSGVLPDLDEVWAGTTRVPPRPLPGVTGVCGPDLTAALRGLEMGTLSPAQLVEAVTGAERLARWAQSVQLAAVKAFADYAVVTDEDNRDHPLTGLPDGLGGSRTVETGFGTQREIERFCADGIGAALGTTYTAAQGLIDTAYFTHDVPLARRLLEAGRVDTSRLRVLARELAPVGYGTDEDRDFVDDLIGEHAGLTAKQLEVRLREAVIARDPESAREVHRRAAASRGVWVSKRAAGMAGIHLRLRAEEAQLAYQALNAAAWSLHDSALAEDKDACRGEYRSFDQFRADAFMTQMLDLQMTHLRRGTPDKPEPTSGEPVQPHTDTTSGEPAATSGEPAATTGEPDPTSAEPASATCGEPDLTPGEPKQTPGDRVGPFTGPVAPQPRSKRAARMMDPARVMLHLYMTASTLLGHDDKPATLLGYGPIGADQARALAEDATVVRLLSDPFTRDIRAIDLPAYRVPKILRWAVQARDRACVFPGCDTPSYDTQLDHITPHPFARKLAKAFATGTTSFANLQPLCTRHHLIKTHGGWTIQSTNGSRLEWVSPTGHSYRRNPEWGPPAAFWDNHQRGHPIDQPPPPASQPDAAEPDICPF